MNKSDKLMDALFQEGQSAPQTPQTLFDTDFEGLASNAEYCHQTPQPFFDTDFEGLASNAELYIFNQDDSQE